MKAINKFLKDLFTGKDNQTWDLGRILWFQGCIVYFGMTFYAIFKGQAIDPMNWATGFGALLAAGGAALMLKNASEPSQTTTTIETPPSPPVTVTTTDGEGV